MKIIVKNKTAKFNYFLSDNVEAGIELKGCEVKSLRDGKVNLGDSFVRITNGEMFLVNTNISKYDKATLDIVDPRRDRKLLLHKSQISKFLQKTKQKGLTIVPTMMYFQNNIVKVEIALAKGKMLYDKRETLKENDAKRDMEIFTKNQKYI